MNLDSIKETFLIESSELLEQMESSLLELEKDPEGSEAINAIFRAAHTIKGSGGMFGYENIVEFTHVVETFLDKVRQGEISINSDIVANLLACHDHIKVLIDIDTSSEDLEMDENTRDNGKTLLDELNAFIGNPKSEVNDEAKESKPAESSIPEKNIERVQNPYWHISIRLSEDALRNGLDPLSFVNYLKNLGEIKNLRTITFDMPELDEMDAESCYIGFEIVLEGDTNAEEIRKVFEFLEDDSVIIILEPKAIFDDYKVFFEKRNEKNLADILEELNILTSEEINLINPIQLKNLPEEEQTELGDSTRSISQDGKSKIESELPSNSENKTFSESKKDTTVKQKVEKPIKKPPLSESKKSIRIDAEKLDKLINLVGELVINSANVKRLSELIGQGELMEATSIMTRLIEEIRESVMNVRMVEIGESFKRFERVVRDTSRELNKKIELTMKGIDTELDKNLVEKIADPLMHIVRNAIDHGIEKPEIRAQNNKSETGNLQLIAYHDTGSIVIEVKDDGGGLDTEKILSKAIEKGVAQESKKYSKNEIYSLIFEPGFSTAESVTNLSGRGVGMDVVRKNIESLRGTVEIESELKKGTTIRIRLPLTMAIIDGFLVTVDDSYYVIPLEMVLECIESSESDSAVEGGNHFINFRGEVLPFLRLKDFFNLDKHIDYSSKKEDDIKQTQSDISDEDRENVIVVKYGRQKAGLIVDQLHGQFQTVIKPLGRMFNNLQGISGATILGSGEVALILDIPRLVNHARSVEKKTNYVANVS